jgi:hypothetical protein
MMTTMRRRRKAITTSSLWLGWRDEHANSATATRQRPSPLHTPRTPRAAQRNFSTHLGALSDDAPCERLLGHLRARHHSKGTSRGRRHGGDTPFTNTRARHRHVRVASPGALHPDCKQAANTPHPVLRGASTAAVAAKPAPRPPPRRAPVGAVPTRRRSRAENARRATLVAVRHGFMRDTHATTADVSTRNRK